MEDELRKSYKKILLPITIGLVILAFVVFWFAFGMPEKLKRYKPLNSDLEFVKYGEDLDSGTKTHFFYSDKYYPICKYKSKANLDNYFDFEINGDEAYISKYKGKDDIVYLPEVYKHNGKKYKVTKVLKNTFSVNPEYIFKIYGTKNIVILDDYFLESKDNYLINLVLYNFENLKYIGLGQFQIENTNFNDQLEGVHAFNTLNMYDIYVGKNLKFIYPSNDDVKYYEGLFNKIALPLINTKFRVSKKNKNYVVENNCLFSYDKTTLYRCYEFANENLFDNYSINKIASFAFVRCNRVSVAINTDIDEIAMFAFIPNCYVEFNGKVNKISSYVFGSNYMSGTKITFNGDINEIENNAFTLFDDYKVTVNINGNVTSYGSQEGDYLANVITK